MRRIKLCKRWKSASGQSLLETALILPFILLAVFNAINFGYYFIVALDLAAAPRQGVEYSVQGFLTPASPSLPAAGPAATTSSVSYLTYQDLSGLHGTGTASTTTAVRVCSKIIGTTGSGSTLKASCTSFPTGTTATFTGPDPDPEAPLYVLHRVDVQYQVTPLITALPLKIGGINFSLLTPGLTFHRQVSMRAMD